MDGRYSTSVTWLVIVKRDVDVQASWWTEQSTWGCCLRRCP